MWKLQGKYCRAWLQAVSQICPNCNPTPDILSVPRSARLKNKNSFNQKNPDLSTWRRKAFSCVEPSWPSFALRRPLLRLPSFEQVLHWELRLDWVLTVVFVPSLLLGSHSILPCIHNHKYDKFDWETLKGYNWCNLELERHPQSVRGGTNWLNWHWSVDHCTLSL